MAIGLAQRDISPETNRSGREKTYELCRQFIRAFDERNGSTLCSGLLGCDISTPEGFAKAHQEGLIHSRCPKFVRDAVAIVESMLLADPSSGGR